MNFHNNFIKLKRREVASILLSFIVEISYLVIIYENLVKNPSKEIEDIFKVFKLPLDHLETAAKAMKKDAHVSLKNLIKRLQYVYDH